MAGGDTASAFAAKNPVIVKAHPAHPGTSELAGQAIQRAVQATRMPEGTFSLLHSQRAGTSVALATNPKIKAVAFTGSQRAGRALFDAAARRPDPIPVFAEMGSVNPVVILPKVLERDSRTISEGLYRSVLLGVGNSVRLLDLFSLPNPTAWMILFSGWARSLQKAYPGRC